MPQNQNGSQQAGAEGEQQSRISAIIRAWQDKPGPLLPILHDIQQQIGHIPPACISDIARALHVSRADVHGVISFYHFFRSEPGGKHTLYLCRAEACQAMGAARLEADIKQHLGVGYHQNTADGRIRLEPVYCLGNCACSPAVMIDDRPYGRVDKARFDALVAPFADGG